jgi:diguanylate cyclase (GGDEF)-like protein
MRVAVQNAAIRQGNGAAHPVVTISVGVCAARDAAAASMQSLVLAADQALYRAKREGRNRVAEALDAPM